MLSRLMIRLAKRCGRVIGESSFSYSQVDELVIDLKTLKVQLLSSRPKTAIVREIFRSLVKPLEGKPESERLRSTITKMIGSA